MTNPLRKLIVTIALLVATGSLPAMGGDFSARGGVTATFMGIPMIGVSGVASYQTELDPFDLGYIDYQEISFYGHILGGSGNSSNLGESGTVSVSWKSIQLGYFLLKEYGDWKIGPGIIYGIGEMTETSSGASSLSPYFTDDDIHEGSLLMKGITNFNGFNCEATLSSFGGLIGGGFLCGYEF